MESLGDKFNGIGYFLGSLSEAINDTRVFIVLVLLLIVLALAFNTIKTLIQAIQEILQTIITGVFNTLQLIIKFAGTRSIIKLRQRHSEKKSLPRSNASHLTKSINTDLKNIAEIMDDVESIDLKPNTPAKSDSKIVRLKIPKTSFKNKE